MRKRWLLLIPLAGIAAIAVTPWREIAQDQLQNALTAQGIKDASFTIERFTTRGVLLKDVRLGAPLNLVLPQAEVGYDLRGLANRQVNTVHISGLEWQDGKLRVATDSVDIALDPVASPDFKGEFTATNIRVQGIDLPVQTMQLAGDFSVAGGKAVLGGTLTDKATNAKAVFIINASLDNPMGGTLTVSQAEMPWSAGTVSLSDARIPFTRTKPIKLPVTLSGIPLDALMKLMTDGKAAATGAVSGKLPVLLYPSGAIGLDPGTLEAPGSGTINVPPGTFPVSGEQLEIVNSVLQNFHYTHFALYVTKDAQNREVIRLRIEGNNPDAMNARPVNLTITLSGDVISLLQYSILPVGDPKSLLKGAKP